MSKDIVIMRAGCIFTIRPFPRNVPNPARFRWIIYRDGIRAGYGKSKAEARQRVEAGYYDPEPGAAS